MDVGSDAATERRSAGAGNRGLVSNSVTSRSVSEVRGRVTLWAMAEFDVDAMIARFQERAEAVKDRPLPPVAGEERRRFVAQAETDYTDYSLVGNASWSVEDGNLVLRIPLAGD